MSESTVEQAIQGASAAITPSDAAAAAGTDVSGRAFCVNCTVAGNLKVRLSDGTTITIAVAVGTLILPWAVTQVFITGTTATASCFNLR